RPAPTPAPAPGLAMAHSVVDALRRPHPGPGDCADLTLTPSPYDQESQWKGRPDRRSLRALTPATTFSRRQPPTQQLIGGSRLRVAERQELFAARSAVSRRRGWTPPGGGSCA